MLFLFYICVHSSLVDIRKIGILNFLGSNPISVVIIDNSSSNHDYINLYSQFFEPIIQFGWTNEIESYSSMCNNFPCFLPFIRRIAFSVQPLEKAGFFEWCMNISNFRAFYINNPNKTLRDARNPGYYLLNLNTANWWRVSDRALILQLAPVKSKTWYLGVFLLSGKNSSICYKATILAESLSKRFKYKVDFIMPPENSFPLFIDTYNLKKVKTPMFILSGYDNDVRLEIFGLSALNESFLYDSISKRVF